MKRLRRPGSRLSGVLLTAAALALPLTALAAAPAGAAPHGLARPAATSAGNCTSAPGGDAFYTPPSPVPAGPLAPRGQPGLADPVPVERRQRAADRDLGHRVRAHRRLDRQRSPAG